MMNFVKQFLFSCLLLLVLACNNQTENATKISKAIVNISAIPNYSVALNFINDYASFCNRKLLSRSDTTELDWIQQNRVLTAQFKSAFKRILNAANKADSELGLDADPIFDAQDFPDEGFSILATDACNGYVTVAGNDWKDFKLVIKLTKQNNQWLVDGAGIVNVPKNKRASR